jgi:hypothetical protein
MVAFAVLYVKRQAVGPTLDSGLEILLLLLGSKAIVQQNPLSLFCPDNYWQILLDTVQWSHTVAENMAVSPRFTNKANNNRR